MRKVSILIITLALLLVTSAGAREITGTAISISLSDGVTLDGELFQPGQEGPGLILLNMCDPDKNKSAWRSAALTLVEQGFHVLTFDYRGFGESGGDRPKNLSSMKEAMRYWREHWMADVRAAYNLLSTRQGVISSNMGIAGASCGVFMGLELAQSNADIKSLVLLGGPTSQRQNEKLKNTNFIPILIISGDEAASIKWSDAVFAASSNTSTQLHKYKFVTHGTNIFDFAPETEKMMIDWFVETLLPRKM